MLGRGETCDDEHPCGAHDSWKEVCRVYEEFLTAKTIADLARDPSAEPPGETREQGLE